jgi:hypothetical protein
VCLCLQQAIGFVFIYLDATDVAADDEEDEEAEAEEAATVVSLLSSSSATRFRFISVENGGIYYYPWHSNAEHLNGKTGWVLRSLERNQLHKSGFSMNEKKEYSTSSESRCPLCPCIHRTDKSSDDILFFFLVG